jgi:hypothetical protein
VLVFDAAAPFDVDGLHVQALELALRRAGVRTLVLPVGVDPARLGRALRALDPAAVVLTGRPEQLDAFGRLVYSARGGERQVEVFDFRGAVPDTGASTVTRLGDGALGACHALVEALEDRRLAAGSAAAARG